MSFDQDAVFLSFLKATEQKPMEAELLDTLFAELVSDEGPLAGSQTPIRLFFPGIGEGIQAAELSVALRGSTGREIQVHGTDFDGTLEALARDRLSADPNVVSAEIDISDALAPGATLDDGIDLAIASHVLYYGPSESAGIALVTKLVNALGAAGVAVFLHEAPPPSNISALRSTYGGGHVIASAVPLVDAGAARAGVPVSRVEYRSRLRFPRVEISAVLGAVDARGDSDADVAANLVEFVLFRGLSDLREDGVLGEALEDLFARLDPETNELEWQMQLQLLPSSELAADPVGFASLQSGVERIRARVPEIEARHFQS